MGIPKASIKKFIKNTYDVTIEDDAAEEIAKMLEARALEIAKYAVKNAEKRQSQKVTAEDIDAYKIKPGN